MFSKLEVVAGTILLGHVGVFEIDRTLPLFAYPGSMAEDALTVAQLIATILALFAVGYLTGWFLAVRTKKAEALLPASNGRFDLVFKKSWLRRLNVTPAQVVVIGGSILCAVFVAAIMGFDHALYVTPVGFIFLIAAFFLKGFQDVPFKA